MGLLTTSLMLSESLVRWTMDAIGCIGRKLMLGLGSSSVKRIACIGAGYVGGPTCSVIAKMCPDM